MTSLVSIEEALLKDSLVRVRFTAAGQTKVAIIDREVFSDAFGENDFSGRDVAVTRRVEVTRAIERAITRSNTNPVHVEPQDFRS